MKKALYLPLIACFIGACQNTPAETSKSESSLEEIASAEVRAKSTLAWANTATIYEVNIRQYSPEGTINAFTENLDRLQHMGVKILWMMPIQPIGKERRKGTEGSYYSISDYTAINPEFGTMEDFKNLVKEAHARDMKVILDWVANHTSYDHPWTESHPEWYTRDSLGTIIPPVDDWSDVADLNYLEKGLWKGMREQMKFWVEEADVDGFRCDVAMMVPMEFWNGTRQALDSLKPMFMLAEAEGGDFHETAFDMTYGWENHHIFNKIAAADMDLSHLKEYLAKEDTNYAPEDLRMNFITNHDENSWNGTVKERMGANGLNYYVLCVGMKRAMPLIYSGQEAGLNKRLEFFEKDPIDWADTSRYAFYRAMSKLKAEHPALLNGAGQSAMNFINSPNPKLLAFSRNSNGKQVLFCINFGNEPATLSLTEPWESEEGLRNYMTGAPNKELQNLTIAPNDFLILTDH